MAIFKKMLYPLRQKRSFFRAFFKVFSKHSVFNRQNTKKTMFLTNPKKSESEKGHFTELFCLFFIDDVFSSFLTRFDEKKSFSRVFLLVFSRPRAQAFFEKVEKLEVFCLFFCAGYAPSSTGKYNKGVSRAGGGVLGEGVLSSMIRL